MLRCFEIRSSNAYGERSIFRIPRLSNPPNAIHRKLPNERHPPKAAHRKLPTVRRIHRTQLTEDAVLVRLVRLRCTCSIEPSSGGERSLPIWPDSVPIRSESKNLNFLLPNL